MDHRFVFDLEYPGQSHDHRLSVCGYRSRYYEANITGHPDNAYPAEGGEISHLSVVLSWWYKSKLLARYIKPSKKLLEWIEKEIHSEFEIMSR